MTSAPRGNVEMMRSAHLVWYKSSDSAERGFCGTCGGNLFWRQFEHGDMSITAGTLDVPTSLALEQHIFVADKSDYYSIDDALPQKAHW